MHQTFFSLATRQSTLFVNLYENSSVPWKQITAGNIPRFSDVNRKWITR
ncbi:TPA: hypothetical protein N0F65_005002 [Lagenidium giganteum]|uniref:Uncharacterized protein n=1 Tax=Lagenidium giganteum TaxID=4803 RepID=A0AAV2ZEW9_9STRA|nr:TPA: hypothetical protein N0F65_005002 [Lagenidium giganteum]